MRSKSVLLAATLAALLLNSHPLQSQTINVPKQQSLEDLQAQALKQNAEMVVAEAEARLAEAKLHLVRQQIAAKVAAAYADVKVTQAVFNESEARLERLLVLLRNKSASEEDVASARLVRDKYRAHLNKKQAELQYLTGNQSAPGKSVSPNGLDGSAPPAVPGTANDKLRKALDMPMKVKYDTTPLGKVLKDLEAALKINVVWTLAEADLATPFVALNNEVPVGAVFQLIEDIYNVRFVVRDYGLVAIRPLGPNLPQGALSLHDFWKQGSPAAK